METTIFIRKCTINSISTLFKNGINKNANIKFYEFIPDSDDKCKALIKHSSDIELKENRTYTLDGLLTRCETKLDKLKHKLSDLETKLYAEQCKQHEMLSRRGWGYGMRHSKIGLSTTREDSIKERIANIKQQIKELE